MGMYLVSLQGMVVGLIHLLVVPSSVYWAGDTARGKVVLRGMSSKEDYQTEWSRREAEDCWRTRCCTHKLNLLYVILDL